MDDRPEQNSTESSADATRSNAVSEAERNRIEERRYKDRSLILRDTALMFLLVVLLVALTNIFVTSLLQMDSAHKLQLRLSIIGAVLLFAPLATFFGLRWAKPYVEYAKLLDEGGIPTLEKTLDVIKTLVSFPIKLGALVTVTYQLAAFSVVGLLKYKFGFSNWEILAIASMSVFASINIGVFLYYGSRRMLDQQLRDAIEIAFQNKVFKFDHVRVSMRLKVMLVFFMVVAYILMSSVMMGYSQVSTIQKKQVEENLWYMIEGDPTKDTSQTWFMIDDHGNFMGEENPMISPEDIKKILASKDKTGLIQDDQARKMIVFQHKEDLGMIIGAVGFWGKSESTRQGTGKMLAILVLATLLLCVIATYLLVGDVDRPLKSTVDYLDNLWSSNGSGFVEAYSDDEMGMLIGQVMKTTVALKDRTAKSESVLAAIRGTITSLNETVFEVRCAGEEQQAGVREQVTAVEEALSASSEIVATSKQISENSTDVEAAADTNANACSDGTKNISESLMGFTTLNDHVKSISDEVIKIDDQYQRVQGVVAIIQEIATQVDLLALNAQIEAAGAGEDGKRFAVVAEEVSRLAARTVESVKEIKSLINNVDTSLNQLVEMVKEGTVLVQSGSALADNVGTTISDIQSLAEHTTELARGITLITRQQTSASEQMADTIRSIHDSAQLIMSNTERVANSMSSLGELSKRLEDLISETEA